MSGLAMLAHLFLESFSRRPALVRQPERASVMGDLAQNEAFERAGREDGILAHIHLYQAIQSLPLICPGDRVLDLGCGPASQLLQIARLNPQARFTGLDASAEMLARARETVRRGGATNIDFVQDDMTRLERIGPAGFDCVLSTMSLHHLPDEAALAAVMRQARRVLKPGGGIYFVDFGRLKRQATQRFFAHDRRDIQPELFTLDFYNSLRAAFSVDELAHAFRTFGDGVERRETALAPFMVVFKSAARRTPDASSRQAARIVYRQFRHEQRRDFDLFARWFRLGGLDMPFDPAA